MSADVFAPEDIPFIRVGSQEFNDKKKEISDTVRIALGLVTEESITCFDREKMVVVVEESSTRFKREELVMDLVYKGIKWQVRREQKKLRASAFRLGHHDELRFLYDSQREVRMPFEEVDSVRFSLSAFLNELAKCFPSIYCDLVMLRVTGKIILDGATAGTYFMLSKKIGPRHWDQLGYVLAKNGDQAAQKMGLEIIGRQETERVTFLNLKDSKGNEYSLERFQEVNGLIES